MKPHSNLIYFNRFSKPRKRCRVKGNWELQFCHGKTALAEVGVDYINLGCLISVLRGPVVPQLAAS